MAELRSNAGGAAMAAGSEFQAWVSVWWCGRILLQTPIDKGYKLPHNSIAKRIYCETTDYINDIRIESSENGLIYGQCKRSIRISRNPKSIWASVIKQFYQELERICNHDIERRFVLFYEESNTSLERLQNILNRYRQHSEETSLFEAAKNSLERDLVKRMNILFIELNAELPNFQNKINELLRITYIHQLKLGELESDRREMLDSLRHNLLENPEQINEIWDSIFEHTINLQSQRGSTDRKKLRRLLSRNGILLKDSVTFRSDLKKLDDFSSSYIQYQAEKVSTLSINDVKIHIERPIVQEMVRILNITFFLVVGGAGTGKSGCLFCLAQRLKSLGKRVWYWSAESLPYSSSLEIRNNLQLNHSWYDIFSEVASGTGAVLIIDGLDSLKNSQSQHAYRELIERAINNNMKVVASIRSFDLRYSKQLQGLYPVKEDLISPVYIDEEFQFVSHVVVSELNDDEFHQVITKLPIVEDILNRANQLRPVVRNLFSLDLFCKLISRDDAIEELSATSTQADLFELYWNTRVESHKLHNEMTNSLRQLIESMVELTSLKVIPPQWSGEVNDALFSAEIIRHPITIPSRLPEEELVEFSHNILFDYAAELLFIHSRRRRLIKDLSSNESWTLFLRPSLKLFYLRAFRFGPHDFWELLLMLERSSVSLVHKYIVYLIVAEETHRHSEFHPILDGLNDDENKQYWIKIIQGVISAATYSVLPKLFKIGIGDLWIELAIDLIHTKNSQLVYSSRRLLFTASDFISTLSQNAHFLLNQAAIFLIKFHWKKDIPPSDIIRVPIKWACQTISSQPDESTEIIRRILTPEELERVGFIQAYEVTRNIEKIWPSDPSLAIEVYDSYFKHEETDESTTLLNPSQILPLISNRRQTYENGYYLLSEKFPSFLRSFPSEATIALIRAVENIRNRGFAPPDEQFIRNFRWLDIECNLLPDGSRIWDRDEEHPTYETKMLQAWENYLVTLPSDEEADEIFETISNILIKENKLAAIWRRLLRSGCRNPEYYSNKLWTILNNIEILLDMDLSETIKDSIERFIPLLSEEAIQQIENLIFSISRNNFSSSDTSINEQLANRIKTDLLVCMPENYRSSQVIEYLESCEPGLVQTRQRDITAPVTITRLTSEEWLRLQGIEVESPKHQELLSDSSFIEQISENDIRDDNYIDVYTNLCEIESKLVLLQGEVDREVFSLIQNRIIYGFSKIACSDAVIDREHIEELFSRFRAILSGPVEHVSEQELESFDRSQGSDALDPHSNASRGFMCLTKKVEGLSEEIRELLKLISEHPKPIVRFHLGLSIWSLFNRWPEFVWVTLEEWVSELLAINGTIGVLKGTLNPYWYWHLRNNDENRAKDLIIRLIEHSRLRSVSGLLKHSGKWLALLYFTRNESWAEEYPHDAISNFQNRLDELEGALNIALHILLPRTQQRLYVTDKEKKALHFIQQLLLTTNRELQRYNREIERSPLSERPSESPSWLKQAIFFLDRIGTEFRLCAETQSELWSITRNDNLNTLKNAWWSIVEPILMEMIANPHPHFLYKLVQGLEHIIVLDIPNGIHWLQEVTMAGAPMQIANEALLVDHTMNILERIVSEYTNTLVTDSSVRSCFLKILNVYLQTGWPRSIKLTLNIESIFR